MVTFSYRTEPESPPDVQTIQKQMAIVAWQPGPNRVVAVPTQVGSLAAGAGQGGSNCWQLWPDKVVAMSSQVGTSMKCFLGDCMVASVAWQLGPHRCLGLA